MSDALRTLVEALRQEAATLEATHNRFSGWQAVHQSLLRIADRIEEVAR